MVNIFVIYGGDVKININSLPHHLNLAEYFPEEVNILAEHLGCYREDISMEDDFCGGYIVMVKGKWWGMIDDIEYLMEKEWN